MEAFYVQTIIALCLASGQWITLKSILSFSLRYLFVKLWRLSYRIQKIIAMGSVNILCFIFTKQQIENLKSWLVDAWEKKKFRPMFSFCRWGISLRADRWQLRTSRMVGNYSPMLSGFLPTLQCCQQSTIIFPKSISKAPVCYFYLTIVRYYFTRNMYLILN